MTRTIVVLIFFVLPVQAQNFQPPSWGQGVGQGQGQGQGRGIGQGSQNDPLSQQIQQLQRQINVLREKQRRLNSPHVEMQTGPVLSHPVSGKEIRHTTQTLMDGTKVDHSDISYFYRDAAGRMRAEGPNEVEVLDVPGRAEYDIVPARKTYSKWSLSGDENFISVAVFGNSSHSSSCGGSGCAGRETQQDGVTEDLGQQMVNGVMAKGSRITVTIPVGAIGNNHKITIVNERWYSDDLQLLVKSINTDPRFGVSEYELTNISRSPPDPSLFAPPSDYTLVASEHGERIK